MYIATELVHIVSRTLLSEIILCSIILGTHLVLKRNPKYKGIDNLRLMMILIVTWGLSIVTGTGGSILVYANSSLYFQMVVIVQGLIVSFMLQQVVHYDDKNNADV